MSGYKNLIKHKKNKLPVTEKMYKGIFRYLCKANLNISNVKKTIKKLNSILKKSNYYLDKRRSVYKILFKFLKFL